VKSEIRRAADTKIFMEGPEVCRLYYKTDNITFGSSQLSPGQTGAIDPGHPDSHEVFFVSRGIVLLRVGDTYYEMQEGDAVLVPPTVPHQLTNVGSDIALVTWSLAPSEK
jgi:mannose-6-phosphate isomerase-like protein (cupin superfamily)